MMPFGGDAPITLTSVGRSCSKAARGRVPLIFSLATCSHQARAWALRSCPSRSLLIASDLATREISAPASGALPSRRDRLLAPRSQSDSGLSLWLMHVETPVMDGMSGPKSHPKRRRLFSYSRTYLKH